VSSTPFLLPQVLDAGRTMTDPVPPNFPSSLPSSPTIGAAGSRSRRTFSVDSITNIFSKMLPLQDQSEVPPIESTSGGTYTWPVLAETGATEQIRIPIIQDDVFICMGGVDVVKLLRISRASAYSKALTRADSYVERNKKVVLVDEQYVSFFCLLRIVGAYLLDPL
jgi:hypothetical protein